ncbi:MAG: acyl-CoA dehydrogenase family protein, partial [Deltaproteobacteria bacterium]
MGDGIYDSEEHRIFRDSFRKFVAREITPHVPEWEDQRAVPRSIWLKMGQEGYLCPWLPEEYGGLDLGFEYSVIINDELLRGNAFGVEVALLSDVASPYI